MGLFISLEGCEGSGKTMQAGMLVGRLRDKGYSVIPVHEPGSTELGQYLRPWLKSHRLGSYVAELFLFAAARSELIGAGIKEHLTRANTVVVADRYADSTTAYQGYGRRLPLDDVRVVNDLATQGVWPHLTVLLDISPEAGLDRGARPRMKLGAGDPEVVEDRRQDEEGQLKFENESLAFHRRVRDGYLKMASAEPERWFVIDASMPPEDIAKQLWDKVWLVLCQKTPDSGSSLSWGG